MNKFIPLKERASRVGPKAFLAKEYAINVLLANDPTCCFCCAKLTEQTFTLEHLVPLAKGGNHDFSNIEIACSKCNQKKKAMTVEEYMKKLSFKDLSYFRKTVFNKLDLEVEISPDIVFKDLLKRKVFIGRVLLEPLYDYYVDLHNTRMLTKKT